MARIPDTPETRGWLQMNDYAKLRELQGAAPISQDARIEELEAYLAQLLSGVLRPFSSRLKPAWISGFYRLEDWRGWDSELGFNFSNVDQDATAGELPHQYQVLKGRFDPTRIDRTLREDPSYYGSVLETVEYGGTTIYIWGKDDAQNLHARTLVRPIGVGGRLTAADGFVYWAQWSDGAEEMIDAANDRIPSLADVASYGLMAQALTRLNAYSVELCGWCVLSLSRDRHLIEQMNPPNQREGILEALEAETLLLPIDSVATVSTVVDGRWLPYDTFILIHEDEDVAKENEIRLRQRIASGTSVDGGRVAPDGFIEALALSRQGPLIIVNLTADVGMDVWDLLMTE